MKLIQPGKKLYSMACAVSLAILQWWEFQIGVHFGLMLLQAVVFGSLWPCGWVLWVKVKKRHHDKVRQREIDAQAAVLLGRPIPARGRRIRDIGARKQEMT